MVRADQIRRVVSLNLVCDLGMTGGPGDQGAGGGQCFARLRRTLVGEAVVGPQRPSLVAWIARFAARLQSSQFV